MQWPVLWQENDISAKKMVPIVFEAVVCGQEWHQRHVVFHSDNAAVALLESLRPDWGSPDWIRLFRDTTL